MRCILLGNRECMYLCVHNTSTVCICCIVKCIDEQQLHTRSKIYIPSATLRRWVGSHAQQRFRDYYYRKPPGAATFCTHALSLRRDRASRHRWCAKWNASWFPHSNMSDHTHAAWHRIRARNTHNIYMDTCSYVFYHMIETDSRLTRGTVRYWLSGTCALWHLETFITNAVARGDGNRPVFFLALLDCIMWIMFIHRCRNSSIIMIYLFVRGSKI